MRAERNRLPSAAGTDEKACHQQGRSLADARSLYNLGRAEEALALLGELIGDEGRTPQILPGPAAADLVLLKAWCLLELKRHAQCREWLAEAKKAGWVEASQPGLTVIELNLALFAEEYAAVQAGAEQTLTRVTNPADRNHAELRLLLGAAYRWLGRLDEAIGHVEFACSGFTVLDLPARAAVAANFLGWTHLSRGGLEDARRWFEKSMEAHARLGSPLRLAQTYQNLAIVCYKQGDYDPAIELLNKELDLVGEHPDMTCRARLALGNVLRLHGDLARARSSLLEAFALAEQQGLVREETLALEYLGDVFRDESNPAEALRFYGRGMALAQPLAPRGDLVMELKRRQGECLDLEGKHEEAQFVLTDALELAGAVGDRFETAVIRRCLGVNAANLGRWKLAGEHLRASLQELRGLRARHEAMLAAFALARTLLRQIDSGNAGGAAPKLLEQAWSQALMAQQWQQELDAPVLAREIDDLVAGMARRRLLREELRGPLPVFSSDRVPTTRVIAVSEAIRQVLKRCDGYSRYKNPVLILGEYGTGKELLARRIHEISPRGAAPLVRVNCNEGSPEQLAREIFGIAPGASPQVIRSLPGLVTQAEGGTLLLCGIEDLPRDLQARILRLIQEGAYRPVGDAHERLANIRVIATSETDLAQRADRGLFRQDLYFRLRQMSVTVPSLRERTEDIVPLLDHFLTRLNGSTLKSRDLLDLPSLEALTEHRWPGNVGELEAVGQQAWLNRDQGRPLMIRIRQSAGRSALEFVEARDSVPENPGHQSGMTWTTLNALIERAGGNKARVARNLGISRITLYRWLKQLDPESIC